MDHRIHPAQRIDLVCDAADGSFDGKVADDHVGHTGCSSPSFSSPFSRAGVEHDIVPIAKQRSCRSEPKAVTAPGDEHSCHGVRLSGLLDGVEQLDLGPALEHAAEPGPRGAEMVRGPM